MLADSRTVDFLSLLYATAKRCGLDPDTLAESEAAALAEHLTVAARQAWQHYDWPDTVGIAPRLVRPIYAAGTTYASGAQVFNSTGGGYYQSVQNGNIGHALTDAAWWTKLGAFAKSLDLVVPGSDPISEVLAIWDRDPDLCEGPLPVGFRLTGSMLILGQGAPNAVWVSYRRPSPLFTSEVYDAAKVYQPGDLFLFTDRHCYLVLTTTTAGDTPTSVPAKFRAQTVPLLFVDGVKRFAKSEWLSAEGQTDKALAEAGLAAGDLDAATAQLSDDQGQTRRYAVATRTRSQFQPRRFARR